MAKVQFSKLGIKKTEDINEINFNGNFIQVRQYLPIEQTLNLASDVLNMSVDQNRFYNPAKIDVAFIINIIKYYTNIEFTDKELEKPADLYDMALTSGLYEAIKSALPDGETEFVRDVVDRTIKSIYEYNNSVMGILNIVTQDYGNLKLDAEEITKNLSNKENLTLLKDVMTKLG